jgi:hypothetical protein
MERGRDQVFSLRAGARDRAGKPEVVKGGQRGLSFSRTAPSAQECAEPTLRVRGIPHAIWLSVDQKRKPDTVARCLYVLTRTKPFQLDVQCGPKMCLFQGCSECRPVSIDSGYSSAISWLVGTGDPGHGCRSEERALTAKTSGAFMTATAILCAIEPLEIHPKWLEKAITPVAA